MVTRFLIVCAVFAVAVFCLVDAALLIEAAGRAGAISSTNYASVFYLCLFFAFGIGAAIAQYIDW